MRGTSGEYFDWKKFMILNRRNLGLVVTLALAGGILLSVLFYLKESVWGAAETYRSAYLYHITFDREQVDNIHDYYNDYTWNDVLDSDKIAGVAAGMLGDFTKEEIGKATTIPTMSDIRFIWVYAEDETPENATRIQEAVAEALAQFGDETEGFDGIEIWDKREVKAVEGPFFWGRTVTAGFVLCLLLGVFVIFYKNAMDDSVYTEEDVACCLGTEAAGTVFAAKDKDVVSESLTGNLAVLLQGKEKVCVLPAYEDAEFTVDLQIWKKILPGKEVFTASTPKEAGTDAGLVWLVPYGRKDGRRLMQEWKNLQIRSRKADAVVIVDADKNFYRLYYGKGKKK